MAKIQSYGEYLVERGLAYYHYEGRGYLVGEFTPEQMEDGTAKKKIRKAKKVMRVRCVNSEIVYDKKGMPIKTAIYICKPKEMKVDSKRGVRLQDRFLDKIYDFKKWCKDFKEA